jgi:hypothetical protein
MKLSLLLLLTLLLAGCATYTITPQNLKAAFATGNPSQLTVIDKEGKEVIIYPSNHTGIRVTKQDGSKHTFYFITAIVKDTMILGSKSAFYTMPIEPIYFSEIQKIELDSR